MCCLRHTYDTDKRRLQSEQNLLNFGDRIKTPIIKLKYDSILKDKMVIFFKNNFNFEKLKVI